MNLIYPMIIFITPSSIILLTMPHDCLVYTHLDTIALLISMLGILGLSSIRLCSVCTRSHRLSRRL